VAFFSGNAALNCDTLLERRPPIPGRRRVGARGQFCPARRFDRTSAFLGAKEVPVNEGVRPLQPQAPGSSPVPAPSGSTGIAVKPPNWTSPPVEGAAKTETPAPPANKIRAMGQALLGGHHQQEWKRPTNLTGNGATHVRSFHAKLTGESLEFLDKQINDWLDSHPDYEVKMVTTTVGEWTGKLKEPNIIVQVWV
jgi:hypothetical protein